MESYFYILDLLKLY